MAEESPTGRIKRTKPEWQFLRSPKEAIERLKELCGSSDVVSFDFETTGLEAFPPSGLPLLAVARYREFTEPYQNSHRYLTADYAIIEGRVMQRISEGAFIDMEGPVDVKEWLRSIGIYENEPEQKNAGTESSDPASTPGA